MRRTSRWSEGLAAKQISDLTKDTEVCDYGGFFPPKDIYFCPNGGKTMYSTALSPMFVAVGRPSAATAIAFGIVALAISPLQVPLQASTIVSITGNESGGLSVEGGSQVVAQRGFAANRLADKAAFSFVRSCR